MQYLTFPDPVIAIVGPTASGKTMAAIQLAEQMGTEIVSADSRYFYRGMDIGTAKPSPSEQKRVPHHLIDVANPDENWSLSDFQQEASCAIRSIQSKGKIPILVGGTGQYFRAVVEGWQMPELAPDPELRDALTQWALDLGPQEFLKKLAIIDPVAAQGIEASNVRRTVRAMEVILKTGRKFSEQRRKGTRHYSLVIIGLHLPRAMLYQRIDERIDQMIELGLLEETRRLIGQGYPATLPAMSAIGYAEMAAVLSGEISMDEAIMLMKRRTRQYVRRQANWFKQDDPTIHWIDAQGLSVESMLTIIKDQNAWLPKEQPMEADTQ